MKEEPANNRMIEALEQFILKNPDLDKLEGMLSDFNVFETLNMVNSEIRHSNMLAWLFNPKENHGLDDYFLHNFLKTFVSNNKSSIEKPTIFDLEMFTYSDVEVRKEYKNIDLLIIIHEKNAKLVIAIENKVLSSEHSEQLDRYHEIVHEEFKDYDQFLLFLSPDKTNPSNDAWIPIDYNDVVDILNSVDKYKKESLSKSVAEFIDHYNTILKRYFMGNSEIEKICKNIYKKHSEALDLIFQYRPDNLSEISKYLQKLIERESTLEFDSAGKTVIRFSNKVIDSRFEKNSEGWLKSKRLIAYEFSNYDRLVLRLYLGPADQKIREEIFDIFKKDNKLFTHAKGKLYERHNCIYQSNFVSKKQYEEDDLETIMVTIDTKWKNFLENDMLQIDKFIEENWVARI